MIYLSIICFNRKSEHTKKKKISHGHQWLKKQKSLGIPIIGNYSILIFIAGIVSESDLVSIFNWAYL
jgi:hypothetical protein